MISFTFCFIFCLIVFFLNYYSFLNSLLVLESISLILFYLLTMNMIYMFSLKVLLYYFVFIVSESALGLSVLVKCIKFFGVLNFRSMNLVLF